MKSEELPSLEDDLLHFQGQLPEGRGGVSHDCQQKPLHVLSTVGHYDVKKQRSTVLALNALAGLSDKIMWLKRSFWTVPEEDFFKQKFPSVWVLPRLLPQWNVCPLLP